MTRPGSKVLRDGEALERPTTLEAVLERVLGWWARRSRSTPAQQLWAAGADSTASFAPRGGLVLTSRSGIFLVTQEGDPADHVLVRGETFRAAPRGRVAAWALAPGVLEVRPPRSTSRAASAR